MEAFITSDGAVAKFIHADGSETAVKVVESCSNFKNPETGYIDTCWVDRNKYSVFISSSLGCYMHCPFCHLTIKDSEYRKLQTHQVIENVKEAILHEVHRRPDIQNRYIKLCWMGMGDALNQPVMVREATLDILNWVLSNGFAQGLDCVDLSTVMPRVSPVWVQELAALNRDLQDVPVNPLSFLKEQSEVASQRVYSARSRFRLFYSLHSAIQTTRDKMVPGGTPLSEAVPLLKEFMSNGPNVLLHQLFVEALNDSPQEVEALCALMKDNFPEQELRVLRYNYCDRSPYREWDSIDRAVLRISECHPNLKVQVSAGKEVAAACGQFLVAMPRSLKAMRQVVPEPARPHSPLKI